jgi:hypothetical protein
MKQCAILYWSFGAYFLVQCNKIDCERGNPSKCTLPHYLLKRQQIRIRISLGYLKFIDATNVFFLPGQMIFSINQNML